MSSSSLSRCCGTAAHILVLSFVALVIFGGTALVIAFFLSLAQGSSFGDGANWYVGMICGLIAWMFVAVFHFRKESIQVPLQDREAFGQQVKTVLGDLGYDTQSDSPEYLAFRPAFQSYLLGGGVQVKVEGQQARITGPKVSVEALRKRLRFQNHLKKITVEERKPQGDRVLKRAKVVFRMPADNWREIFDNVVKPLAAEGEVVCQVQISVVNDKGIAENTIDGPVRQWLEKQSITPEIHKTHGQTDEAHRNGHSAVLHAAE